MLKVKSSDWKHMQFNIFYNVFYKSTKTCFMFFICK